jgi:hypothetical protein
MEVGKRGNGLLGDLWWWEKVSNPDWEIGMVGKNGRNLQVASFRLQVSGCNNGFCIPCNL